MALDAACIYTTTVTKVVEKFFPRRVIFPLDKLRTTGASHSAYSSPKKEGTRFHIWIEGLLKHLQEGKDLGNFNEARERL